jgi:hypothetical protein
VKDSVLSYLNGFGACLNLSERILSGYSSGVAHAQFIQHLNLAHLADDGCPRSVFQSYPHPYKL